MLGVVYLGGYQQHRFALAAQKVGNLEVCRHDIAASIHRKQHQIGVLNGPLHLLLDFLFPHIPRPQAPGIHQLEAALLALHHALFEVAGNPRHIGHHCKLAPGLGVLLGCGTQPQ